MTVRLVALISALLLLSLAAFGLLVNHYQGQVMEQVARTASDVGRATLRTLDLHGESDGQPAAVLAGQNVMVWQGSYSTATHPGPHPGSDRELSHPEPASPEPGSDREVTHRRAVVERILQSAEEGGTVEIRERVLCPEVRAQDGDAEPGESDQPCLTTRVAVTSSGGIDGGFFIDVADVRAESDPAGRLVLKIPKLTPTEPDGSPAVIDLEFEQVTEPVVNDFFFAREEIHLPIEVGHYRELFDDIRSRSLLLFLGVFVVGTVLSTGLAAHFTRPIRKLDAGIRQLSAGDLDVRVQPQGKDEIGRLARAFNEMAGKLRANRERSRELVRREKLSALGRLAAGVAHDVRNPLHSIGLTLQHLRETARPEAEERAEEFDRSLEIIRGEIGRLDQLVGNFLRFAKSERREREPVVLSGLLEETARLVQKEAERRRVVLKLDAAADTPPVQADLESLRSCLLNLVLNSFEAMPEGGTLELKLASDGREAVLEVSDTGQGIPEEHQEHVFDFAFTTREGGNGLGLAMVHHCIVEEHGGRVSLDSRPGEGTRVRMVLPVVPPTAGGEAST